MLAGGGGGGKTIDIATESVNRSLSDDVKVCISFFNVSIFSGFWVQHYSVHTKHCNDMYFFG
jgi:hypothetical protein